MKLRERLIEFAHAVDRRFSWHKLPLPLSAGVLVLMRDRLREANLFDTGQPTGLELPQTNGSEEPAYLTSRTWDGTYNDLETPLMGSTGSRFGRNVPLEHTFPEQEPRLSTPSARKISRDLMTRDELVPATTLNVLAAAWIQFEVHDWFSHGPNDLKEPYEIGLGDGDDWPENPMIIRRTPRDTSCDPVGAQTWMTGDTHWWDSSQIYGRDAKFADKARTGEGGKLRVEADGTLPEALEEDLDYADVPGTMWTGLYALHVLFSMEHNAIADRLRAEHPTWSDEQLYEKARLVNSALIAKIHTLDWTPSITASPTLRLAMRGNWWGLAGKWMKQHVGRIGSSELLSGIPGSPTDHHGVPYSLTEEFVAVYRMHPLIPDEYEFRSLDDNVITHLTFPEINALHARKRVGEISMLNTLYSMGTSHPGAITLHNYPRFLQHFDRPDGFKMDLAAIDILRSRERGVPRYTQFRELFHMKPIRSFEELTPNEHWQQEIRDVYDGDIDAVDLQVGLLAEPFPKGFGFSDTAFRVFILMASRRLKSDRFFTTDYRPEVYTQAGIEWVENNDMRSVLLRHFPQLERSLEGVRNPFAPWARIGSRQSEPANRRAVAAAD
ncbi:MAG: peroxidase family protein [Actinomycetota bacterium]